MKTSKFYTLSGRISPMKEESIVNMAKEGHLLTDIITTLSEGDLSEQSVRTVLKKHGISLTEIHSTLEMKEERMSRVRNGNQLKNNVDYPLQNPDILRLSHATQMKKYGGIGFGSKKIHEKTVKSRLAKRDPIVGKLIDGSVDLGTFLEQHPEITSYVKLARHFKIAKEVASEIWKNKNGKI